MARFTDGNERSVRHPKANIRVNYSLGPGSFLVRRVRLSSILRFMERRPSCDRRHSYLVVAFGFVFNSLAMGLASALRGAGDTRTPMTVNMVANVINVVFNWILIWGKFGLPKWGVFGAGVATTFSRSVAAVWFLIVALKGDRAIRLDFSEKYRPIWGLLRRICNVGLPAAGEQLILRTGQVMFAKVVSSLGTVTFAAHQVSMNILSLTFMPGMAFATGCTTLVGQNLGAKRPQDAERCANTSRDMGLMVGGVMALVFLFFGKYITMLYTDDMSGISFCARPKDIRLCSTCPVDPIHTSRRAAGSRRYQVSALLDGHRYVVCSPVGSSSTSCGWGSRGLAWNVHRPSGTRRAHILPLQSGKWKAARV